jgi:hypothetical protein
MNSHFYLLLLTVFLFACFSQAEQAISFYVSPKGNDSWSGKLPAPNKNKTDGPFATLERARDAVRELKEKQGGELKQTVNIYIRGGTYFLKETFVLTPIDSGTKEHPITYSAYRNEKPIISGGRIIKGWRKEKKRERSYWLRSCPRLGKENGSSGSFGLARRGCKERDIPIKAIFR